MHVPTHLQHQPVVGVHDYSTKDGVHANNTDAEALSLGVAQYDDAHFSAKVFRHTGQTWSRQSEELPLHRVLDLAILLAATVKRQSPDQPSLSPSLNEQVLNATEYARLKTYLQTHANIILPRLQELKALL